MTQSASEQLNIAADSLKSQVAGADVGVVLGSGLGGLAARLTDALAIPYSQIPGMPVSGVSGHAGQLWLGTFGAARVLCLQGRAHRYEGHAVDRVVFGVRLLARLGCKSVLLSNAAGGIDPQLTPGSLMLISDHLNLSGVNPLFGESELGERFVDMSQAYDRELQRQALAVASKLGLTLAQGVYAGVLGPSYETPAEIRMLRTLGASAVGMSTVLEVIALRQLGVRVGAVSCITNAAAGVSDQLLSHGEVKVIADQAAERFEPFMDAWAQAAATSGSGALLA